MIGVTGAAAGLKFKWSCLQILPVLSSICGVVLPTDLTTSSLYVHSGYDNLSTSRITLYVTDSTYTRSSTVITTILVQKALTPHVDIIISPKGKFFPADQLKIITSVQLYNPGNATWFINDSSIDTSVSFLSPITTYLPGGLSPLTLTFAARVMSPGSTLNFVLKATGNKHIGKNKLKDSNLY